MASIFLPSGRTHSLAPKIEPAKPVLPKKRSILVVDDIESTREFVSFLLRNEGYEVYSARDGRSALELAAANRPELVILDVLMPGLDGYTVCRQLKAQPAPRLKVIMFSALNSQADKMKAQEAGADAFMEKPVESAKLLSLVKSTLA